MPAGSGSDAAASAVTALLGETAAAAAASTQAASAQAAADAGVAADTPQPVCCDSRRVKCKEGFNRVWDLGYGVWGV